MTSDLDLEAKNKRILLAVLGTVCLMVVVSFASVPLYDLFCRVTGYGGTTQVADALPEKILERSVKVQFDTMVSRDLPWEFSPVQRDVTIKLGAKGFIAYNAANNSDKNMSGVALYNVVPAKVGKYFHKIQCFCFGEMPLEAGQRANMPVVFFIDPKMDEDPQMNDVKTITLSYTFYKMESKALEDAQEEFYNREDVSAGI